MKVGLVGQSYVERSLPFDAQRTINLMPVIDETQQGKEVAALYGTPGLSVFATAASGPVRGVFCSANGRAFALSADLFYELDSAGTATYRGTIDTTGGNVTFAENPTQLAICDGTSVYIFTYATNGLAIVSDVDLPTSTTITFQDGYFIISKASSGSFYISAANDGTNWNALDFATAESSPDNLLRVFSAIGQLWLFGERTIEVWYNTGNSDFPFSRIEGAKMEVGCAAAHTVCQIDNSIFWVGKDKDGQGIVYRANGYSPMRISTHAIERILGDLTNISQLKAFTYSKDGRAFYVITGADLDTSLVYDASTKLWHERAYLADGAQTQHLASCCMYAFSKHLVGDRTSGNVYEMSQDYYSDAGAEIRRQRVFTHIFDEGRRHRMNALQVDFESGVGLQSGQGSAPVATLEISSNGGRTWSNEYQASIGAVGNYRARCVWRRLGTIDPGPVTFRVTITDPVKVAICGAYLT